MARFDNPVRTPEFHIEMWEYMCSDDEKVAIAAPRGHAKSTAVTHAYVLANVLFRVKDHVMIVSDTESQAAAFLLDIKTELSENEVLVDTFDIDTNFIRDRETELICRFKDGHVFRIIAKGSEQKLRGTKWNNKRPDLIVGDDLENDELVMNDERRDKFRRWFYNALLPAGNRDCHIRIVGTILHLGSLLESFMPKLGSPFSKTIGLKQINEDPKADWVGIRYKAHNEDFTEILWPEQFDKNFFVKRRQGYLNQGFPEGYSQEYLNFPIDLENAYFKKDDMMPLGDSCPEVFYMSADFAISEKDRAAYTVFAIASITPDNTMRIRDIRRFRGDAYEIIDTLFSLYVRYEPEITFIEQENIARTLGPVINKNMQERNLWPRIEPMQASQDKIKRARALQARMRAGMVEFDTDASWYIALEQEMLTFPRGEFKDQVDALAWLAIGIEKFYETPTQQELFDDEYEDMLESDYSPVAYGMNAVTGY